MCFGVILILCIGSIRQATLMPDNASTDKHHGHMLTVQTVFLAENTSLLVTDLNETEGGRWIIKDRSVVRVSSFEKINMSTVRIHLFGKGLGRTRLVYIETNNQTKNVYNMLVIPRRGSIHIAFDVTTIVVVLLSSLMMGALLDVAQCRKRLLTAGGWRATMLGLSSQWIMLPPFALGLGYMFRYSKLQTVALFAAACSPVGTKSLQWTVLFGGDVDLSAVISCLSTISAFITMPLWMFVLNHLDLNIRVPYLGLLRTLAFIIVPYISGIGLTTWKPKLKDYVRVAVKPVLVIVLIFFISFGVYVSLPMFRQLHWTHALSAPALQWLGCGLGYLIAITMLRTNYKEHISLALCIGYQNISVVFLLVRHNFPQPESDISLCIVLIIAAMGSLPLWIGCIVLRIRQHIAAARQKKTEKRQSLSSMGPAGESLLQAPN